MRIRGMEGEKGPRDTFPHPTGLWSAIWSGHYNVTEVFEMESDMVRLILHENQSLCLCSWVMEGDLS